MIGRKKYITILASGLFLFPLLFQSFHQLHHKTSACDSGHNCEVLINEHQATNTSSTVEYNDDIECLVCEYKFVLVKLSEPAIQIVANSTFANESIIPEYIFDQKELFSPKSPRAPPIPAS